MRRKDILYPYERENRRKKIIHILLASFLAFQLGYRAKEYEANKDIEYLHSVLKNAAQTNEELAERFSKLESNFKSAEEQLRFLENQFKTLIANYEKLAKAKNKEVEIKKKQVIATAYSLKGHTFSGLMTMPGVVAVDPEVIPLGSVLKIPGYGYGIAVDRGEAIKGDRIDLFFLDERKARHFGSKKITIEIIGRIENFDALMDKLWGR
ncbi:MAG: hypothetical protein KatS3mg097_110 [Candidatus Parcubacteria bacterium]|nr:MAG: hypothetical protein KatS3mg097_110 [Candidatus Parcubacteria bacterium]